MTLAIKRGFQSDGKSQLERIALRVTGGNGEEKAYYRFQVNPQNLKENLFLIYLKTKKPLKKSTRKKKII